MVEDSFLWFRVYRDAAVLKGVKREKMQMPEILICHILKRQRQKCKITMKNPRMRKAMANLDSMLESTDITNKCPSSQSYGFSSSHVWM